MKLAKNRTGNASRSGHGLIFDLLAAYPGRSAMVILLLLLAGFVEGVGVMAMLPLLSLATGGGEADVSTLGRWTRDLFGAFGVVPTVGSTLTVIVAAISAKSALTLVAMKEVGYAVAHVVTDLRLQLIRALLRARWRYYVAQPVGALANAVSSESVRAGQVYQSAAQLIALAIQALVYAAMVLLVSWQIALAGLIASATLAYLLRSLINATRRAGNSQTELLKSLTARLTDALHGIKPIKAMGREKELLALLELETRGLNEAQQHQVWNSEMLRVIQEPLLVLIIAIGLYATLTVGAQSFASVMVLVFLFYRLLNRMQSIQMTYQAVAISESAYFSLRDSIAVAESECETNSGKAVTQEFREVRFDDVCFGYDGRPVLKNVSLDLRKGDFVAILGPSGAGKTSLMDLLLRLADPESGEVRVDGVPLRNMHLEGWRQQIGYVPQELLLFHDSILNNVSLGDPDIARTDVEAALRLAGAWDFVASAPAGLDTVIGERGTKLSGGQRQRISLARALVRRPRLLVLDEVTSALDPKTESDICATLKGLAERTTILAVSHQPAILRAARRAYRLADGELHSVDGAMAGTSNAFQH